VIRFCVFSGINKTDKNAQECQGGLQGSAYISKMSSNFENLTDRDVHEAATNVLFLEN
jgi:hypothetical protein